MTTAVATKTATKTAVKAAVKAATKPEEPKKSGIIEIARLETEKLMVPIIGTTPLIVHRFSEKAKKQMLDAMQGIKKVKENKNPNAEFEAAFYRFLDGRFGFPSIAFKDCTVSAARFYQGVTMVQLRQVLFVGGEFGVDGQALIEIEGAPAIMREDVVRVGMNGTDLRYRPQFTTWRATLPVRYVKSQLSRDSVLSLIHAGGMGVGVGEWRPEKSGDMGTFAIDEDRELVVVS